MGEKISGNNPVGKDTASDRNYVLLKKYLRLAIDPVFVIIAILAYLYLLPRPAVPEYFAVFSEPMTVVHTLEFAVFSFIIGIAVRHSKYPILRKNDYFAALFTVILIGIGVEMHQQIRMLPGEPLLRLIRAGTKGFVYQIAEMPMYLGAFAGQMLRWLLKNEKRILDKII